MANKIPITSTELATLWMTYQKNIMMQKILEYFLLHTQDEIGKNILQRYYEENNKFAAEIEQVFTDEGAVIPLAFQCNDVRKDAPPLYDNMFGIMFLRLMTKIGLELTALHLTMSYRSDIQDLYKRFIAVKQEINSQCTGYLLEKGVLPRPPNVSMPKEVEFIQDMKYMRGLNLFGDKRSLNTLEVSYIYQAIEGNIFGAQLLTGFAQVAKENDVRNYFIEGKELAKKIVENLSHTMSQSDIQPPSTWIGRATDSTVPPFSDKLMMFCSSLISAAAIGGTSLGTTFSMRSDLPAKLMVILKDTFQFASKGAEIMIKHHWLEEPPQMEDRNQLTMAKQ